MSDLSWTSAVNGWGPVERDRSNGGQATDDGKNITVGGTVYAKGLGVHATSHLSYYLRGSCTTFRTRVGVGDGHADWPTPQLVCG